MGAFVAGVELDGVSGGTFEQISLPSIMMLEHKEAFACGNADMVRGDPDSCPTPRYEIDLLTKR